MSFLCRFGRHVAGPQIIANAGIHFAWCARCGCDLILGAYCWSPVPKGYKLVWKRRRAAADAIPDQLELDFNAALPAKGRASPPRRRRGTGRTRPETFGQGGRAEAASPAGKM